MLTWLEKNVRLLLGQKKIEIIVPSYGSGLGLKLSPSEAQIMMDTGTQEAPTISIGAVSGGTITAPAVATSVSYSAWLDDHTIVSVDDSYAAMALDLTKRTQTKLGAWPESAKPLTELVAVTATDYYVVVNGSLLKIPRS